MWTVGMMIRDMVVALELWRLPNSPEIYCMTFFAIFFLISRPGIVGGGSMVIVMVVVVFIGGDLLVVVLVMISLVVKVVVVYTVVMVCG